MKSYRRYLYRKQPSSELIRNIRKVKLIRRKCNFMLMMTKFLCNVNWTNSQQISRANESNFLNYKDSNIVLIDGKSYVRHNVIYELYQDHPTILKVEPSDRDPNDLKQDFNYTNTENLAEYEHRMSQPIRDHYSIFSKSSFHHENLNVSKLRTVRQKTLLLYNRPTLL